MDESFDQGGNLSGGGIILYCHSGDSHYEDRIINDVWKDKENSIAKGGDKNGNN